MTAVRMQADLGRELTVVYADLPVQVAAEELSSLLDLTFMLWLPRQVCDAAS